MAKATALVLKQDGSVETFQYTDGDYKVLQNAVGGLIESVSWAMKNIDAYVNEEGLYTPGLEVNPHAFSAIGRAWMGNIVVPRLTENKLKRLRAMDFDIPESITV